MLVALQKGENMNIRKRYFRRPVSAAVWLVLLTAASLLLSIGASLLHSARQMQRQLEEDHTTIAAVKSQPMTEIEPGVWTQPENRLIPKDAEFLLGLDCVEGIDFRTVTTAYSPRFAPDIGMKQLVAVWGQDYLLPRAAENYNDVILAGTIVKCLHEKPMLSDFFQWETYHYLVEVEQVLAAHDAFGELPQRIEVEVTCYGAEGQPFEEKLLDRCLSVGDRIVFSGSYDPQLSFRSHGEVEGDPTDFVSTPTVRANGQYQMLFDPDRGELSYYPLAAFYGDYRVEVKPVAPAMAKLDGSVEDFFAAPENEFWRSELVDWNIRQHSVVMMGTSCMESMYGLVSGEVTLAEGRLFSQEEYDAGARVCVLPETLALRSGLSVGDMLPISQYSFRQAGTTYEPIYDTGTNEQMNNPCPHYYNAAEGDVFLTQDEEFTVVGIVRMTDVWSEGAYAFTGNTVFAPQKALTGAVGGVDRDKADAESWYGCELTYGVYSSVLLKNGTMEEFLAALEDTSLEGRLITLDTGYAAAKENLDKLVDGTNRLVLLIAAGWVLLMLLYVLLYQSVQRRDLGMMRSVGATRGQTRRYLFFSGLVLAAVAIALGVALSAVLAEHMQGKLLTLALNDQTVDPAAMAQMIESGVLPFGGLLAVALVQTGVLGVLLWLHAALLSHRKPRKLMGV